MKSPCMRSLLSGLFAFLDQASGQTSLPTGMTLGPVSPRSINPYGISKTKERMHDHLELRPISKSIEPLTYALGLVDYSVVQFFLVFMPKVSNTTRIRTHRYVVCPHRQSGNCLWLTALCLPLIGDHRLEECFRKLPRRF